MTHEHMDHIQGLPYAERYVYTQSEPQLRDLLNTQYAWLTASAAEDYRNTHPKAEKAELNFERDYAAISSYIHSSAYVEASGAQQLAICKRCWISTTPEVRRRTWTTCGNWPGILITFTAG